MVLEVFRIKTRLYCQSAGYSLKALASEMGLHPSGLSHKLHGTNNSSLVHSEVKQIIKILAQWQAITRQSEAIELLELMDMSKSNFTPAEWSLPPLNILEIEKPVLAQVSENSSPSKSISPSSPPSFIPTTKATRHKNGLLNTPSVVGLHNLPVQPTSLVGREHEVAEVRSLLSRADVRLLTLTGSGGIGKTRLALRVAAELLLDFTDGVFLVELAATTDPNLVQNAIAHVFGLKEKENQPQLENLKSYLQSKQLLLILDNFEQIIASSWLIKELLANSPLLKILVTSRTVLHIYGEHEFGVPPLALPDLKSLPSLQNLIHVDAVALLVQRARAIDPHFALDAENARYIAEICVRLDGLPLAIELAAARLKVLSPEELLTRLSGTFGQTPLNLLTRGAQDLPSRQQTLRNTIDWSYQALEEDEKQLFARMAIFVGGCNLEAAEKICSEDNLSLKITPLILPTTVLDCITSLLDKSMLRRVYGLDGKPRFSMLETVREYALEKLNDSSENETLRQKHANYYLQLAEEAKPDLRGATQPMWLDHLESNHDNFRAALSWFTHHDETLESALKLGSALWWFWLTRGYLSEGRYWLEMLLVKSAGKVNSTRFEVLLGAGVLAHEQNDYQKAQAYYEEGLELSQHFNNNHDTARLFNAFGSLMRDQSLYERAKYFYEQSLVLQQELGNKQGVAHAYNNLGVIAMEKGDYDQSKLLYQESLNLRRELDDKSGIAVSLLNLGAVLKEQHYYEQARKHLEEALALSKLLGNKQGMANAFNNLGMVARHEKKYDQAQFYHEQSLDLKKELGNNLGVAHSLHNLACIATDQNNFEQAIQLFEDSLIIYRELGYKFGVGNNLCEMGWVFLRQSNYSLATSLLQQSLCLKNDLGDKTILWNIEGLAIIAATRQKPEQACKLLGAVAALSEKLKMPMPAQFVFWHEQAVNLIKEQVRPEIFYNLWSQGESLTLEQTINECQKNELNEP